MTPPFTKSVNPLELSLLGQAIVLLLNFLSGWQPSSLLLADHFFFLLLGAGCIKRESFFCFFGRRDDLRY